MAKQDRTAKFAPGGIPKYVRCYDNGGATFDRYTVVFTGRYRHLTSGEIIVLGMSARPFHPQGFGLHSTYRPGQLHEGPGDKASNWPPAIGRKGNLGTRIPFEALPEDCKRLVRQDYADLWDITF
jgi:hypothetical protein